MFNPHGSTWPPRCHEMMEVRADHREVGTGGGGGGGGRGAVGGGGRGGGAGVGYQGGQGWECGPLKSTGQV